MFDKHITLAPPSHITKTTTVHEHRAPTDDSVRLLKEMEQAAREKVVSSVRVENTKIDCVLHAMNDPFNCSTKVAAHIRINGHDIEVLADINEGATREQAALLMVDAVSKRIAVELLADPFRKVFGGKFWKF